MFDGYLSLAGQEIINSERTATYIRNLAPRLGLRADCCDCDSLSTFFGETYTTPLQDEPSWFAPYRAESSEFLGLIPLALEGFDDSTLKSTVTQLTGDGAVTSRPRNAGREMRVSALLAATSEKGLDYGMAWLRNALAGSGCSGSDCAGDDLCYLSACPDICDDDLLVSIYDVNFETLTTPEGNAEITRWAGSNPSWTVAGPAYFPATTGDSEASLTLSGLTPGAVYRVELHGGSTAAYTVEVIGTGLEERRDAGGSPLTLRTIIEFLANDTTHRLRITSTSTVEVYSLDVERTVRRGLLMASYPSSPTRAGEVFAWGHTTPASTTILSDASRAAWSATHTGTGVVAAGGLAFTRRITGMTVGQRYVVNILAGASVPMTIQVAGSTGLDLATTTVNDWYAYEFVATATNAILSLANTAAYPGAAWTTTANVGAFWVEEDLFDIDPDPVLDHSRPERTLRSVTVTSGVEVTEVFDAAGGFMQRVEWSMIAGQPRPLGNEVQVTSSLGPGAVVEPERDCVNGQVVLHNLIANGSFEIGTIGWTGLSGLTLNNPASTTPYGAKVLRATAGTALGAGTIGSFYTTTTLKAGVGHTLSLSVRQQVTGKIRLEISNPAGNLISPTFTVGPEMRRVSFKFYPGMDWAGTTTVTVAVNVAGTGWPLGRWIEIDGVSVGDQPFETFYVDGSIPGGLWQGLAYNSTSLWRNPANPVIVDPDCVVPPSPPRPPVILNSCVLPGDNWFRYTIEVPSVFTQVGQVSYPKVILTTGDLAARGVRVRVQPNPFSMDPAELDPCGFCGEFLLSYLPPNASLTVDAATTSVVASVGGVEQTARQLLYGSDGGPMVWPEMTCGTPYVVYVDLDADENPLVDMALSVIPAY